MTADRSALILAQHERLAAEGIPLPIEPPVEDEPSEPDPLASVRNGAYLEALTLPPLTWLVPGLVPEGLTLLVGAPKVGKSWYALDIALSVAGGGRALGSVDVEQSRRVLFLALEDGERRLQDRCARLLSGRPFSDTFDYVTAIQPGHTLALVEVWLDRHRDDAGLVVVDTLGRVMPDARMGETTYSRDYRIGAALQSLTRERPGLGVVALHHDRKAGSDDFIERVSGTNGLAGAADSIAVLDRDRGQLDGVLHLAGRDIEDRELALTMADGAWRLDGNTIDEAVRALDRRRASDGLGDRSTAILGFAYSRSEGVRAGEVAQALGLDDTQARVYLNRLTESGRLAKAGRGLYVPPVTSVSSVTYDDDPHPGGLHVVTDETQVTGIQEALPIGPEAPRFIDSQGDAWPFTGRMCAVCHLPISGNAATHPTCDPEATP